MDVEDGRLVFANFEVANPEGHFTSHASVHYRQHLVAAWRTGFTVCGRSLYGYDLHSIEEQEPDFSAICFSCATFYEEE